jgi:uncharacterized protein
MRQSTRMCWTAVVTVVGAAAALAAGWATRADDMPAHAGAASGEVGRINAPGVLAKESGVPPPVFRLQAVVARAWDDSISTWKRLVPPRGSDIGMVHLRFVRRLGPANCYGLYAGEGPAYCSGNQTIFVGTAAANRLMARFGPEGEAGITFLIGHEMGHHIQNINGRFGLLNSVLALEPANRVDLMRRFELEADCYAGVWIHSSDAWANSSRFRAELTEVLNNIGDDNVLGHHRDASASFAGVHGTSAQRRRWFTRGAKSGDWHVCDAFSAARP